MRLRHPELFFRLLPARNRALVLSTVPKVGVSFVVCCHGMRSLLLRGRPQLPS